MSKKLTIMTVYVIHGKNLLMFKDFSVATTVFCSQHIDIKK